MGFLSRKLRNRRVLHRVLVERLSEPLHLNLLALAAAVFGSFRQKVACDLVLRPQHAYGLLEAAWQARRVHVPKLTVVEFGVASGAGLLNLARIAPRVTRETGIQFEIAGFDTGGGMPPARDYRDHPDVYWRGNYPMDRARLERSLPEGARLVIGDLADTVPGFRADLRPDAPLGFVSLDVDYYCSTVDALRIFDGAPDRYLPLMPVYVDDINLPYHNSACGARRALAEFNAAHPLRPIERDEFLVHRRLFKNAMWIAQMFTLHVLDHTSRNRVVVPDVVLGIENPYL